MAVRTSKESGTTHAVRHAWMAAAACTVVVGMVNGAFAQTTPVPTTHTWIGGTSGELDWGVATNWSTNTDPPSNTVPDQQVATSVPETALINDATTGDRNITTPIGDPITVDLDWTNPAGGTGVNKITLGSNFFFAQTANAGAHSNTLTNNRTADTMVWDLNGFNVAGANVNDTANAQSRLGTTFLLATPMTITNSAAGVATILGGTANVSAGGAIIGSGVHLSQALASNNIITGVTFQDGSILSIVAGPTRRNSFPTAGVYDLNFTTTGVLATDVLVRNDFTISGAGTINFFNTVSRIIRVGGDFTDTPDVPATDHTYSGNNNQIILNGGLTDGSSNPKTQLIHLARTGVTNVQFSIGEASGNASRAQLAADFSTTGTSSLRVVDGSILDVASFDLTTPTMTFDDNTTLLLSFNDLPTESGSISATDLTLSGILNIDLDLTGTWTGPKDLVLMSYSGGFTGSAANINLIDVPAELADYEIRTDNGTVRLTAAAVPEPGTAALAVASAMSLLLCRRRR